MTIAQLIVFVKIAELGNFTKAGQSLNMTQPAVSHAISSLESELDVTLIIRDRKNGIMLTEVGKRILVHVRDILKGREKIEQEVAAEKGLEVGTIRVGTFPTASAHFLPKIIRSIQLKHPRLEFDLYEGTINEVKEWLSSRVIDVGVITPPHDDVDIVPLCKDKMVAVLRDDHPLQSRTSLCLQDLEDEPIIICKGGSEKPIIEMFHKAGIKPQIKFLVHNANALLNMIQEGLGVAILSEISFTSVPPNVQVRSVEPEIWREIVLAVPSLKSSSLAVQQFIRISQELFHV